MNRVVEQAIAMAERGRWRLSKAVGVPGLERLRWSCIVASGVAVLAGIDAIRIFVAGPATSSDPVSLQHAVLNVWVQLAIMVVAALISYALRPKPQMPQPAAQQKPEVEDGTGVREIFGTVWINDPMQLLWRALEPIPIRRKGGKK